MLDTKFLFIMIKMIRCLFKLNGKKLVVSKYIIIIGKINYIQYIMIVNNTRNMI